MNHLEEAGFKDVFVGTELQHTLGVPSYEFTADPIKMQKLKTVAAYLNEHPDPLWVIGRLKNNKTNMSPLDFLASYALIGNKQKELSAQLADAEKEMEAYE